MLRRIICSAPLAVATLCSGPAFANEPTQDTPVRLAQAEIVVVGPRANLRSIPGSGATIEREDLERARVFTVNEALRQVPGVLPRDEEGLGLRPNIGVRGLSPTRSSKVLLLEDGLPLTYAPYGDNATYSHPPIRRFERIEVLKGASQIRFGPNTVGGVVNYITPAAPETTRGDIMIAGGDLGYREFDFSGGGPVLGARVLGHVNVTRFDGVRANHDLGFEDYYLKIERDLGADHALTLRLGYATEDSQVSYSGLTQAEYTSDPFANPFPNDRFTLERATASATHSWRLPAGFALSTSAYSLWFNRDWWRQSSNSGQRPSDSSDPACGGLANLNTTCGNEGRLREYNSYGVESRLGWSGGLLGSEAKFETGLRWHTERQNRLQINSDTPTGRTPGTGPNSGVLEANKRYAEAWSAFASGQFRYGKLTISPGVRFESIAYERKNGLTGARGENDLTSTVPGLGLTYDVTDGLTFYGGVHEGFAPPRVEDVVTNAGGVVELGPEESLNWEAGLRGSLAPGLDIDVAAFLMEFDNQIVPASVAGGTAVTNGGETHHSGLEGSLKGSLRDAGVWDDNDLYVRLTATYVAEAEFRGRRFSILDATRLVTGNRLPYAPEWVGSAALGYARGDWLTAQAEVQYTGAQFADDLNTIAPNANGQRGRIEAATIVNLAANITPGDGGATFFFTVKNLFDEVYIVDRTRGILPGAPRLVQGGVSLSF